MINGIINVYKEKGYTSHDVVAKLRGILKQKKIGHTGTLDPDAEGVLPICLGKATKLCDLLTDKNKTYEAVLQLGKSTDTQDMTGTILSEKEVVSTKEEIVSTINSFTGEYDQIPPMYSALKVNGRKLYELAREGKTIERKPRKVFIYSINILDINEEENDVRMVVTCSKGTYIRTLCNDIGEILGCGGCMKSLVRTKVSRFESSDSLTIHEVSNLHQENKLTPFIVQIQDMFPKYNKVVVAKEFNKLIYNGNKFFRNNILNRDDEFDQTNEITQDSVESNYFVRVYDSIDEFIGIYEYIKDEDYFKPFKMFI